MLPHTPAKNQPHRYSQFEISFPRNLVRFCIPGCAMNLSAAGRLR